MWIELDAAISEVATRTAAGEHVALWVMRSGRCIVVTLDK